MTIILNLFSGAVFFLELLIAEGMFSFHLHHRPYAVLRYALCSIVCAFIGYITGRTDVTLICLFYFLLSVICQWICFYGSWDNYLLVSVAGYALQHMCYQATQFFLLLRGILVASESSLVLEIIVWLLPTVFIYFLGYQLFAKKLDNTKIQELDSRRYLWVASLVLLISVILSGISLQMDINPMGLLFISVYAIICCLFALALLLGMLTESWTKTELNIVRQILQEEKDQYYLEKDTIEMINVKCHDLKHQLHAIRHSGHEIDKDELKEFETAIDMYDSTIRTGNEALDVILTGKSLLCQSYGITLSCIADGQLLHFMKDSDIYSLFGNALDNAIRAVKELPEIDRLITLQITPVNDMVRVHMENKYQGSIAMDEARMLPITSKGDRNYHGFGSLSMKLITEKYSGIFAIKNENSIYSINLLFPKITCTTPQPHC